MHIIEPNYALSEVGTAILSDFMIQFDTNILLLLLFIAKNNKRADALSHVSVVDLSTNIHRG